MDWKYEPARDLGLPAGERRKSVRREPSLADVAIGGVWWTAVRAWLCVREHLAIDGREHLPRDAPFVLVANHTSHLDALVLGAAVPAHLRPRTFPIAAGDTFFETPVTAALATTLLNALPMWRRSCGPHAMQELRERLIGEPCGFILFPEGTRARNGVMQRFRPGVGMLVAGTSVPVVPARIAGAFEAWPAERKRPRGGRVSIRIGPPLAFADVANERAGWETIAARLQTAVEELGKPPR